MKAGCVPGSHTRLAVQAGLLCLVMLGYAEEQRNIARPSLPDMAYKFECWCSRSRREL